MSIESEILRINNNKALIRSKLIELGLATSTDNLDTLAAAIADIIDQGAVSVTVKEGQTYTIPAGYHNGSGTVSGVAGGGSYNLQSKTATPTKKQQSVTPDSGYYGLSDVTIAAIPDNYQDVSSVDAAAADVLTGKVFVLANGTVTAGTMKNNATTNKVLTVADSTFTIPQGYHDGSGDVFILPESKTATPKATSQTIVASSGKVLSEVVVEAIPSTYVLATDVEAALAAI